MTLPNASGDAAPANSLDGLARVLGLIMIVMCMGVVLITGLIAFMLAADGPGPLWAALAGVAIGGVLLLGAWTAPSRQLTAWPASEGRDPARASGQLRSVAFMTMVLSEVPTLFGVTISFVGGGWLPVILGAVLSLTGIVLFGPTRSRLASWNAKLESAGARTGL